MRTEKCSLDFGDLGVRWYSSHRLLVELMVQEVRTVWVQGRVGGAGMKTATMDNS